MKSFAWLLVLLMTPTLHAACEPPLTLSGDTVILIRGMKLEKLEDFDPNFEMDYDNMAGAFDLADPASRDDIRSAFASLHSNYKYSIILTYRLPIELIRRSRSEDWIVSAGTMAQYGVRDATPFVVSAEGTGPRGVRVKLSPQKKLVLE
jgi:hypothetical protein